jgi:protein arginine kinase activator
MKCQREKCSKQAILHITEVYDENQYEEYHLCEDCGQKYLAEPQGKGGAPKVEAAAGLETEEMAALNQRSCPHCGLRFLEFRNTGRLGCPHDYEAFREQLLPLLENIHGEARHSGKTPRRAPRTRQLRAELTQLRKQLEQAVKKENYEEAARLRDRIRQLEQ